MNMGEIKRDWLHIDSMFVSDEERLASLATITPWPRTAKRTIFVSGNYRSASWEEAVAALNRVILRLADGDDVSPWLRRDLRFALLKDGAQLVPRNTKKKRSIAWDRKFMIVRALREALKEHPRKRAYGIVSKQYGVTVRRLEQTMQESEAQETDFEEFVKAARAYLAKFRLD
jgi:hypothetical protein